MRVLVACEFSGVVRRAFRSAGHLAYSCDLLPAEDGSPHHFQVDVREVLAGYKGKTWDLMIAHPPCTDLALSGARWFAERNKYADQREALDFVLLLMRAPIPRIAIENPRGIISRCICKPTQEIQPFEFGEPVSKATCLWLKNLPMLQPTRVVSPDLVRVGKRQRLISRWYSNSKGNRHRTFEGVAEAMAQQWGSLNDQRKAA